MKQKSYKGLFKKVRKRLAYKKKSTKKLKSLKNKRSVLTVLTIVYYVSWLSNRFSNQNQLQNFNNLNYGEQQIIEKKWTPYYTLYDLSIDEESLTILYDQLIKKLDEVTALADKTSKNNDVLLPTKLFIRGGSQVLDYSWREIPSNEESAYKEDYSNYNQTSKQELLRVLDDALNHDGTLYSTFEKTERALKASIRYANKFIYNNPEIIQKLLKIVQYGISPFHTTIVESSNNGPISRVPQTNTLNNFRYSSQIPASNRARLRAHSQLIKLQKKLGTTYSNNNFNDILQSRNDFRQKEQFLRENFKQQDFDRVNKIWSISIPIESSLQIPLESRLKIKAAVPQVVKKDFSTTKSFNFWINFLKAKPIFNLVELYNFQILPGADAFIVNKLGIPVGNSHLHPRYLTTTREFSTEIFSTRRVGPNDFLTEGMSINQKVLERIKILDVMVDGKRKFLDKYSGTEYGDILYHPELFTSQHFNPYMAKKHNSKIIKHFRDIFPPDHILSQNYKNLNRMLTAIRENTRVKTAKIDFRKGILNVALIEQLNRYLDDPNFVKVFGCTTASEKGNVPIPKYKFVLHCYDPRTKFDIMIDPISRELVSAYGLDDSQYEMLKKYQFTPMRTDPKSKKKLEDIYVQGPTFQTGYHSTYGAPSIALKTVKPIVPILNQREPAPYAILKPFLENSPMPTSENSPMPTSENSPMPTSENSPMSTSDGQSN